VNSNVRLVIVAVFIGLGVGALTQIGQSVLPDGFSQLANSISPWVTVAFVMGALLAPTARWAALAGFLTLVFALVGYYALVWVRFGYTGGGSSLILWSLGAIAGGLVLGPAGWSWRNTRDWRRIAAIALLAAVYVAEGLYLVIILPNAAVGVAFAVVGLLIPLLIGGSWRERAYAWLGLVPALLLGALGYFVFAALSTGLAGL